MYTMNSIWRNKTVTAKSKHNIIKSKMKSILLAIWFRIVEIEGKIMEMECDF